MWKAQFAHQVRKLRMTAGLDQAAFAEKLGLSGRLVISNIERVNFQSLPVVTFLRILAYAHSQGISSDMFLFRLNPLAEVTEKQLMDELINRKMAERLSDLRMEGPGGDRPVDSEDIRALGGPSNFLRWIRYWHEHTRDQGPASGDKPGE